MARAYPYIQLDVFTQNPMEGNQLAVIPDARGLSDAEMQVIARETNFSETTFVFPREIHVERERGVQVRIFTPQEELPFAGHPTLGTAFALHGATRRVENTGNVIRTRAHESVISLELKVGKIPVEFSPGDKGLLYGEMTQKDPDFGQVLDKEAVAQAASLAVQDLDADLPAQPVTTGNPFIIVPVKKLETMRNLSLEWKKVNEFCRKAGSRFMYFVCREVVDRSSTLHARMIFYNGEDPATGSAAGPCVAWAVKYGVLASDQKGIIEQGLEMMRPSFLHIRATKNGDTITNVRVGGYVIEVLRGEIYVGDTRAERSRA